MEKPLHVRVAEALGWLRCDQGESLLGTVEEWYGIPRGDDGLYHGAHVEVPRYDTDWSAGGPLFEKFVERMDVTLPHTDPPRYSEQDGTLLYPGETYGQWVEVSGAAEDGYGPTILTATCDLVLRLKGKK